VGRRLEKRIRKIFDNIKQKPDIIIVKNSSEPFIDKNFFYLTGLDQGLFEGSTVICHQDGKIDLIVSELESEIARKIKANILVYKNKKEYNKYLLDSLKDIKEVGLNYSGILQRDFLFFKKKFPKTKLIDVADSFAKTRAVKDDAEIKKIKKATKITDEVIKEIPGMLHEGLHEYELAAEINYLMQKKGADGPAFDTISSFGRNTAMPHYTHGSTRLKKGDFVLCDFGACYKRYNSDITRTFVFGKASEKQKRIHKTVLDAQKVGLKMIKPGVKGETVHKKVDDFINKTEFKGCFIHSTGHSLGIAVHDDYIGFKPGSEKILQENMVLTVEPGIYISGYGGVRIEDDIIVTKNGFEFLTRSPRDLIEV